MSSYNPTSFTFSLSSFKPYHPCIPPFHFNFMWALLSAPYFSHPSPHDLFPAFWSLQTSQVTYKTNFKTMVHTRETTHDISLSGAGLAHPVWCSPNSLYFPAVFITSFFFSRVEFYFLNAPHFHYQFISWWRSRLSPFPAKVKRATRNMLCLAFYCKIVCSFFFLFFLFSFSFFLCLYLGWVLK